MTPIGSSLARLAPFRFSTLRSQLIAINYFTALEKNIQAIDYNAITHIISKSLRELPRASVSGLITLF